MNRLDTPPSDFDDEMVHEFFSLSYANYLVLNRAILQSMPGEWQRRFVQCLRELDLAAWDVGKAPQFMVRVQDHSGKFIKDPLPHYDRGRTRVPLRTEKESEP